MFLAQSIHSVSLVILLLKITTLRLRLGEAVMWQSLFFLKPKT